MAYEEFIPRQRYRCIEFLSMLKRMFPRGPIWNFKVSQCVGEDSIEKSAVPPAPLGGNIQYARYLNGKLWIGVTGSPAKLYSWDGVSSSYTLEASNDLGQIYIMGLEWYDNKIFVATGLGGKLLYHTPGSGVFTQAAPQLLSQTGLYFCQVWNNILYIGTHPNGNLFKYDKLSPGAMSQVLPQAYGEHAVHSLHLFNNKLYGGTGSDANLFEWDGVAGTWAQKAPDPGGGAAEMYALEVYNNELYGGSALNTGFYKWNGSNAWINIPLPAEIPASQSLHFLWEHNGALIGATQNQSWIFKYLNGVVTVLARPSDFESGGSGILAMAPIGGDLYALQGGGDIYKVNVSTDDGRSSLLAILLSCFSTEMERFASDFNKLLRESVPGLSTEAELLTDWERIAGLPDECSPLASTESQRQQVVHNKIYTQYSGLTKQFFIDYAAGLNVTITITDDPGGSVFRTTHKTGSIIQRVTRIASSDDPGTPTERIDGSRLNSAQTLFTFEVTVTADPNGNQDVLECIFEKLKPANTQMNFIKIP
jgi:uncharacterized protein YmfQ (DUF2313 family)